MITVIARCACGPNEPFQSTTITRRDPGPRDVVIDIAFAGICHTDIDHVRIAHSRTKYPIVPGHEIAGIVSAIGSDVTRFAVGDHVGVGNYVDSCRNCKACLAGMEQYCDDRVLAYTSIGRDGLRTHGGYSEKTVVDQDFVVRIPNTIRLEKAAPLLCAGITMYSALRHWKAGPGKRVGVVGLGGLGHIGVQMSRALGAHTTVLDLSPAKEAAARRLGADDFRLASDSVSFKELAGSLDLLVSTVPVSAAIDQFLGLLAIDGTLVNLGIPVEPLEVRATSLLANRRSIAGMRTGGIRETQEMLDFCGEHGIASEVEVIAADRIDEAYQRLLAGDVRFRFVIDNSTLAKQGDKP